MAGVARRAPHETRHVRDSLRASIVGGEWAVGGLPPEYVLQAEFGASRSSVREALELLQAEGLVNRVRGRGTFVISSRLRTPLNEIHGTTSPSPESIVATGRVVARIVNWGDVAAVPPIARLLGIDLGTTVLRVEYLTVVDGEVVGSATNHIAYPWAAGLRPESLVVDFYALLRSGGIRIGSSRMHIDAALTDIHDAALLHMDVGQPLLVVEQVIQDTDGVPFNAAFCRWSGTRTALTSWFSSTV